MSALVDARGCLTPAGMLALQRAPLGQAPADLAQHVAACGRCQGRLLAASTPARHRPGEASSRTEGEGVPWRLLRSVLLIVLALVLAVGALALVGLLRG